jgi:non-heme chloroperoxidase
LRTISTRPCAILAGIADEAFYAANLEAIVRRSGKTWPVELLPDVGHIPLTLEPAAREAVGRHVRRLQNAA